MEYKRGHRGDFENDALQVCAQALCLEDMTGKTITQGFVYYAHSYQREPVEITDELREKAIATITAVRTLLHTGKMPPPIYTPCCRGCSLYAQCLPQAAKKVGRYREVQ